MSDPGQLLQKDQAPSDHSCGALCKAETLPQSPVTSSFDEGLETSEFVKMLIQFVNGLVLLIHAGKLGSWVRTP
jgi:hypothetical protein